MEISCDKCVHLNSSLSLRLSQLQNDDIRERSHLFEGRYENIYLNEQRIPQLIEIKALARDLAADILGMDASCLAVGCWLNDMGPGSVTLSHAHDDYDELLSGVYYVTVPENSGELVLHHEGARISIIPEAGNFIFFSPGMPHEVTRNYSEQHRLSLGFNFGPSG